MKTFIFLAIFLPISVSSQNHFNFSRVFEQIQAESVNDVLCMRQFQFLTQAFENNELWAVEWINSWGRLPSGVFSGHLESVGNFQQCVRARHAANSGIGNLQGQHCMVYFRPKSVDSDDVTELPPINQLDWDSYAPIARNVGQTMANAFCVPSSCSPAIANDIAQALLPSYAVTSRGRADRFCYQQDSHLDARDILGIIFFSLVAIIMAASTIYDVIVQHKGDKPHPVYAAFSVYTNGEKLFEIKRNTSPNAIECLNGLRGLAILWIMLGHRYVMPNTFVPMINLFDVPGFFATAFSTLTNTNQLAVDTFLLLGGLLVTWSCLAQLEKHGKLNLPRLFLHRYLRTTPVLLALVFLMVSFFRHFGDGPYHKNALWFNLPHCEKYWWVTFLHIQNYFNPTELCLSHSWYLSVDYQLYLLSPLLLFAMWKFGKKSLIAAVLLVLLCWGCGFTTFFINDPMSAGVFVRFTYATHIRVVSWLFGMILGYFLYFNKTKTISVNKFVNAGLWIVSISVMVTCVLGHHPMQQVFGSTTTHLARAFYHSTARIGFALSLCWVIFACKQLKTGGIVNWFLSVPQWQPLARMGLSVYLVHVFVQFTFTSYQQFPGYFSNFHLLYAFCGDIVITLIFATFLYLAFEAPLLIIEHHLYERRKKN